MGRVCYNIFVEFLMTNGWGRRAILITSFATARNTSQTGSLPTFVMYRLHGARMQYKISDTYMRTVTCCITHRTFVWTVSIYAEYHKTNETWNAYIGRWDFSNSRSFRPIASITLLFAISPILVPISLWSNVTKPPGAIANLRAIVTVFHEELCRNCLECVSPIGVFA